MTNQNLQEIVKLIRYYILVSTTAAGSGHPTSSLSAAELTGVLLFGGFFKADLDNPQNTNNDRLIFSKGHASPLFYSLYAAAGKVSKEELLSLRDFDSTLEGHPTMRFPYTEVASGSLGQGLGVGLGMALNGKFLDELSYRTYVLMGDSEITEGSVWEAMELASHYNLDNLIGIIDVNRLGQRGETIYGHDLEKIAKKAEAFGWETIVIDGHNTEEVTQAYKRIEENKTNKPKMIVAKTIKGKGVSFLEDSPKWHGKAIDEEQLQEALKEIGKVNQSLVAEVAKPKSLSIQKKASIKPVEVKEYELGEKVATRKAYGQSLVEAYQSNPDIVVLDAETSNSTYAEVFKKEYPNKFFEMFIAEQNMISTALGLAKRGKVPFASSFAAFLTRAFDQIRMAQYSQGNFKIAGSHSGVSIGEDGSSQMALEDLAMTRAVQGMHVFYPSDAVSTKKLVKIAADTKGLFYIRTTRADTPVIYENNEEFRPGGSKVIKSSDKDQITLIGAGITLFEILSAYEMLKEEGILVRVIDLYSIKPIDTDTIEQATRETQALITVEDHYKEGGIYGAVSETVARSQTKVYGLFVDKMPRSGKPKELLEYMGIDSKSITEKVKLVLKK
jgi:transketolase